MHGAPVEACPGDRTATCLTGRFAAPVFPPARVPRTTGKMQRFVAKSAQICREILPCKRARSRSRVAPYGVRGRQRHHRPRGSRHPEGYARGLLDQPVGPCRHGGVTHAMRVKIQQYQALPYAVGRDLGITPATWRNGASARRLGRSRPAREPTMSSYLVDHDTDHLSEPLVLLSPLRHPSVFGYYRRRSGGRVVEGARLESV